MINRIQALRLFEGFSIQRWNDRIRPIELTAMDMHSLKAVLTFFIGKLEELKGNKIDWNYIVEGIVFGLLNNITLSDIKAPVMSKIKKDHPRALKEIYNWVVDQNKIILKDDRELFNNFKNFLNNLIKAKNGKISLESKILHAAQKYSTYREFQIIKQANESFPHIDKIEKQLLEDLRQYSEIDGIKELEYKQDLYEAICIIEQLRYQVRWSQTPRVPNTTVLGHSLYVAILTFFISRKRNYCKKRIVNNFYAALFHDIAESVTRDIISPVKRATRDLPKIVKKIENEFCERELFPKLPPQIVEELKYLTGNNIKGYGEYEFTDRITSNNETRVMQTGEINKYNKDKYNPVDGTIVKFSDEIAAFIEAFRSIEYGITSKHLYDGMSKIKEKYLSIKSDSDPMIQEFFYSFE